MSRLDTERQEALEPIRVDHAREKLQALGLKVLYAFANEIGFNYNGKLVKLYPYSGWFTGKTVTDGRGLDNLLAQLKPEQEPIIEPTVIFTDEFLEEIGFFRVPVDSPKNYGKALDKRTKGMTVLYWNTKGHSLTYFGEPLAPNTSISLKKKRCGYKDSIPGLCLHSR